MNRKRIWANNLDNHSGLSASPLSATLRTTMSLECTVFRLNVKDILPLFLVNRIELSINFVSPEILNLSA